MTGWPQTTTPSFTNNASILSSPLIIDVDGDNELEVLVASRDNNIYMWNGDGSAVESPTLSGEDWLDSTPAAADIDGDTMIELVYADYAGNLYCKDLDATANEKNLAMPSFAADPPDFIEAPAPRKWEPQGWVYYRGHYAYSYNDKRWFYFNTSNTQRIVNLSNNQWTTLSKETGFHYYQWPYSYSWDSKAWFWYFSKDTQWVVT